MRACRILIASLCVGCGGGGAGLSDGGDRLDAHALDSGALDARDASAPDAPALTDAGPPESPLARNRDRLLGTYLDYLQAHPSETQSNGLRGSDLTSVCDLWDRLDPSSQAVYFTLTARLQGSILGQDGSTMLDHISALYRLTGGQNATSSDPGSCGGGEYNRMIMSMDAELQGALVLANDTQGGSTPSGAYDISDIPSDSFWRDSHDLGGPHAPFDLSDETNAGAPRGQVQYFRDPASTLATTALGRQDLSALVDPYAIEMDQDYDCAHNSNPICSYTFYGSLCLPQSSMVGTDIYSSSYGSFDPSWRPLGC